ncbi:MAG: hypothetical protein KGI59_02680 [Patescibacteria group bacterium]|nr:hypothetical protein [Patescibacteria group bacterium]MDE2172754.1 hypothetical protein [Patescibacteria group bacterium]
MNIEKNLGYVVWEEIPRICYEQEYPDCLDEYLSAVNRTISKLKARRVQRIRLGVSWADWDSPSGHVFIESYVAAYWHSGFDVMPCLYLVPPQKSLSGTSGGPPAHPLEFAEFVYDFLKSMQALGMSFAYIELWNEYTEYTNWRLDLDPELEIFTTMIAAASFVVRHFGSHSVLGGMAGVHPRNLELMRKIAGRGLLSLLDVIGFHALRGTWSDRQPPPSLSEQCRTVSRVADEAARPSACSRLALRIHQARRHVRPVVREIINSGLATRPCSHQPDIWLTEYGFSTTNTGLVQPLEQLRLEKIQVFLYADALAHLVHGCPKRIYWYGLRDSSRLKLPGSEIDWNDVIWFHFGDTYENDCPKLLGKLLVAGGPERVCSYAAEDDMASYLQDASLGRKVPSEYAEHMRRPRRWQ